MVTATHAARSTDLPGEARRNAAAFVAQARAEQWRLGGLALPGLLLIGIVALAPIAWLFWLSFRDADGATLVHYRRLLHPSYLISLQSTFELSFLVTAICVALGYPLAYVIAQARARMAAFLLLLVLFPIWTFPLMTLSMTSSPSSKPLTWKLPPTVESCRCAVMQLLHA